MYCWFCGKQNTDTSKFCYNCGKQLVPEEAENIVADEPIIEEVALSEEGATAEKESISVSQKAEHLETPLVSAHNPLPQKTKYVHTLADKEATASFVLSIIGVLMFWGLPIHILGLILGIRGRKAEKRRALSLVGIGITLFSMAIFVVLTVFVITNYEMIINSDFFATVYYSLF